MSSSEIQILVSASSLAQADELASALKSELEGLHKEVDVQRLRTDKSNMDFGTILTVIISSAAITAIAEGIRAWLIKNQNAELKIEMKQRGKQHTLTAKNIRGVDLVQIIKDIKS